MRDLELCGSSSPQRSSRYTGTSDGRRDYSTVPQAKSHDGRRGAARHTSDTPGEAGGSTRARQTGRTRGPKWQQRVRRDRAATPSSCAPRARFQARAALSDFLTEGTRHYTHVLVAVLELHVAPLPDLSQKLAS